MQVNLLGCNVTEVWVALVFVPLNSTALDPTDVKTTKELGENLGACGG